MTRNTKAQFANTLGKKPTTLPSCVKTSSSSVSTVVSTKDCRAIFTCTTTGGAGRESEDSFCVLCTTVLVVSR
jgi:hypothetical protein